MQRTRHEGSSDARTIGLVVWTAALLAAALLSATAATASVVAVKPLKIKPEALKLATATETYSQNLSATGGVAPYTFSLESGSPPKGSC